MLMVNAGELAEALAPARPHPLKKNPKPVFVSLEFDALAGTLSVIEAKYAKFAVTIPASGDWLAPVQVNGGPLSRLATKWPPHAVVEISAADMTLTVRTGKSAVSLERTDEGGAKPIIRTPIKPNRRHKGKVEVPPDPVGKKVELADTWPFSARVPMPQHREKKDEE